MCFICVVFCRSVLFNLIYLFTFCSRYPLKIPMSRPHPRKIKFIWGVVVHGPGSLSASGVQPRLKVADLEERQANYGPESVFINKVLLEHSHLHSSSHPQWLPSHCNVELSYLVRGEEWLQRKHAAHKPKAFIIWPFTEKACWLRDRT